LSDQALWNTVSVWTDLTVQCKCLDRPYRTLKVSGQASRNAVRVCSGRMELCVWLGVTEYWVWPDVAHNTGRTTALEYLKVIELLPIKQQNRFFRCCVLLLACSLRQLHGHRPLAHCTVPHIRHHDHLWRCKTSFLTDRDDCHDGLSLPDCPHVTCHGPAEGNSAHLPIF